MLRFAGLFMSIFMKNLPFLLTAGTFLKIAEFFYRIIQYSVTNLIRNNHDSSAASIIASDFMPYLFSENTKETITNLCQNKEHLLSAMKQYLQMSHYATRAAMVA